VAEPVPVELRLTPAAVAQRIAKFLAGLERANRQPNRREAYHLREALEMIENERYAEAEAAVIRAEQVAPLPVHVARLVETNIVLGIAQMREAVARFQEAEEPLRPHSEQLKL
jgi:hypothetical protein